jgi:hypothetical protein
MTVTLRIAAAGEDVAKLGYAAHLGRARLDEAHGPDVQQATEVQQGRHALPTAIATPPVRRTCARPS